MARIKRAWAVVLGIFFYALCIRFLLATIAAVPTELGAVSILIGGTSALGYFNPQAALLAFVASVPWLTGLGQATLIGCDSPLSLVFCSIALGIGSGRLVRGRYSKRRQPTPNGLVAMQVQLAANALVTAVLASLFLQFHRHWRNPNFWHALGTRTILGFGDPFYFLTSAFLWLQGLYLFKFLVGAGEAEGAGCPILHARVGPIFLFYGAALGTFALYQFAFQMPDPLLALTGHAYFLPLEDISSFGSFAVALLVYAAASLQLRDLRHRTIAFIYLTMLSLLVLVSWSRASWLIGALMLLVITWIRLPRRLFFSIAASALAGIVVVNLHANDASWLKQPYLNRLIALVRLEKLANKSPDRMFLYMKARDMIAATPLTGVGIGSFYRASALYRRSDDPNGDVPDFAHNAVLEVAAELGVPVALFFCGLVAYALWRGFVASRMHGAADSATESGAVLAFTAYLLTQMTANSLNVYLSNQMLFWFLMAVMVTCRFTAKTTTTQH